MSEMTNESMQPARRELRVGGTPSAAEIKKRCKEIARTMAPSMQKAELDQFTELIYQRDKKWDRLDGMSEDSVYRPAAEFEARALAWAVDCIRSTFTGDTHTARQARKIKALKEEVDTLVDTLRGAHGLAKKQVSAIERRNRRIKQLEAACRQAGLHVPREPWEIADE